MAELTPTSHAILGLLALRPWTTYELAQQMQRAIGHFWPRAESKLYEEPKKLVAQGLAKATPEAVGRRQRTVYSITAKGRRALAAWVPRPAAGGPVVEFEALLKVFFAEHGTTSDLLATLDGVRAWADEQIASGVEINRDYLEGPGPFDERLAWNILVGRFLTDFDFMVRDWAAWAHGVVRSWPDDVRDAEPDMAALQAMSDRIQEHVDQEGCTGTSNLDE